MSIRITHNHELVDFAKVKLVVKTQVPSYIANLELSRAQDLAKAIITSKMNGEDTRALENMLEALKRNIYSPSGFGAYTTKIIRERIIPLTFEKRNVFYTIHSFSNDSEDGNLWEQIASKE